MKKPPKRPVEGGPPPQLLSTRQAAKMLNVSARTILRMGGDGTIPPPIRVGPHFLRWRLADILALIERGK